MKPQKPQPVYKTEEQLKEEARLRRESRAEQPPPVSRAKKKRENFWYHYKWHTVAGIALALFAVFLVRDLFFRTDPDVTVILVSHELVDLEVVETLEQRLGEITGEMGGRGKVTVDSIQISLDLYRDDGEPVPEPEEESDPLGTDGTMSYLGAVKLAAVVAAGSDPLYLLSGEAYGQLILMAGDGETPDASLFQPLELAGADETGGLPLEGTVLAGQSAFAPLAGYGFYLRDTTHLSVTEEYRSLCLELLWQLQEN